MLITTATFMAAEQFNTVFLNSRIVAAHFFMGKIQFLSVQKVEGTSVPVCS